MRPVLPFLATAIASALSVHTLALQPLTEIDPAVMVVETSQELMVNIDSENEIEKRSTQTESEFQVLETVVVSSEDEKTEMTEQTQKLFNTPGAANDPLAALSALPGITSETGQGEPAVRGSAPEDNDYRVDELPVSYLFHMLGYSIFSDNVVQDFDLQMGAFPAQYAGGTGAAIHVSLRDPKEQKFRTSLDFGMLNAGIFVEGSFAENHAFYVGYRKSTLSFFAPLINGDEVAEDEGVLINKFPDSDDLYAKYLWKVNANNRIKVFFSGARDGVGVEFTEDFEELVHDPAFGEGAFSFDHMFGAGGITWQHTTESGNNLNMTIGDLSYKQHGILGPEHYTELVTHAAIAKVRYDYLEFEDHVVSSGLERRVTYGKYDMKFLDQPCDRLMPDCSYSDGIEIHAKDSLFMNFADAFVQDEWFLTDQLTLTTGLHVSYDDYVKDVIVQPRIKGEFVTYDDLTLSAAIGRHHQFPQIPQNLEVFGNPELNNQTAMHYVAGVKKEFFSGWKVKSDVYYKTLHDIVMADGSAAKYSNSAEGIAYGAEFFVEKEKLDKLSGWLSVSLSRSERTNELTDTTTVFALDKPLVADLVMNYEFNQHWSIGGRWNIQSGSLYTPVIGSIEYENYPGAYQAIYGELNSERTPFQHRLDLKVEYQREFGAQDLSIYLDLINAYNHSNVTEINYNADYSEEKEETDGLSILPLLGVKYSF